MWPFALCLIVAIAQKRELLLHNFDLAEDQTLNGTLVSEYTNEPIEADRYLIMGEQ